ncbi:MAG: cytochrome c peroxidase [Chloroherpetonaceae bacterium]
MWRCVLLALFALLSIQRCNHSSNPAKVAARSEAIQRDYQQRLAKMDSLFANTIKLLETSSDSTALISQLQTVFVETRREYKRMEWFLEDVSPGTAKLLNGPPLPDYEPDDDRYNAPSGFQVLEELLFADFSLDKKAEIAQDLNAMQGALRRMKELISGRAFDDAFLFDAMRLEIVRIIALGMSGFDAPVTQRSFVDAQDALLGIEDGLNLFASNLEQKNDALLSDIREILTRAKAYLQQDVSFNDFDRLTFITDFANPLSEKLYEAQTVLEIPFPTYIRPFSYTAKTVFEKDAFNPEAYTPSYARGGNPARVELGRLLFNDPILSQNGKRACASCHQPEKAFGDGLPKALTIKGEPKLRNTPTLLNATLQASSSYDQSTQFLEDRVMKVLESKDEMHSSLWEAAKKLQQSEDYVRLFKEAFGNKSANVVVENGNVLTADNLKIAIGAYLRTLVSLNSRFDQYMRGDKSKMTDQEKHGFNLFMGKAKCGTCHFMPLFNGTIPPTYASNESEVIGVPKEAKWKNATIDPDTGKSAIVPHEIYRYAFKTTSVRNAELTAPYMHNGVYKTLDEVMQFYNVGGGKGIGIELPHQTLPFDSLGLSKQEIQDVIAFVKTLTDTTGLTSRPLALPKMSDLSLNRRKLGGEY